MHNNVARLFEIERVGETVVVIPQAYLSEFAFQQLDAEAGEVLEMLDQTAAISVVIDCCNTDFFGSTALGFFMKLWRRVRRCNGHMAFCNVSDHEKEILHVTKTDTLWSICSLRSEALEILRKTVEVRVSDGTEEGATFARTNSNMAKRGRTEPATAGKTTAKAVSVRTASKNTVIRDSEIRLRAYEQCVAAGNPAGDGVNFWMKAEQELRQAK